MSESSERIEELDVDQVENRGDIDVEEIEDDDVDLESGDDVEDEDDEESDNKEPGDPLDEEGDIAARNISFRGCIHPSGIPVCTKGFTFDSGNKFWHFLYSVQIQQ